VKYAPRDCFHSTAWLSRGNVAIFLLMLSLAIYIRHPYYSKVLYCLFCPRSVGHMYWEYCDRFPPIRLHFQAGKWYVPTMIGFQIQGCIRSRFACTFSLTRTRISVYFGPNSSNPHMPEDANGNVADLINADGSNAAHYEYSPCGRVTSPAGGEAANSKFRFSTKYWDDETGLGYWTHRYYHPDEGRWMSRDPIGEESFFAKYVEGKSVQERRVLEQVALLSIYSMLVNNPINLIDAIGLVQFKNCDRNNIDKTKLGDMLKAVCDYINNSDKFKCCFGNDSGLDKLKEKCKNIDSYTIECSDQDSPFCSGASGWAKPFGSVIHLCGKTASGSINGEPASCTLMHELVHTTGSPLARWPERSEECFPPCQKYKDKQPRTF
jgi:RHS repeat-associated protein